MTRVLVAIGMTAIIVSTTAAQGPAPRPVEQSRQSSNPPRFDVASVKVNQANDVIVFNQAQKGRFTLVGYTLAALIRSAYRVQEFQIVGGPEWIDTERFNVEAP